MAEIYAELKRCLEEEQLVALATIVDGPRLGSKRLLFPDGKSVGSLGLAELNIVVSEYAKKCFNLLESGREIFEIDGEHYDVFIDVHLPLPKLVIIGAVHIAIPLVEMARVLGFHTVVVDARSAFATRERFPHADELIVRWPAEALENMKLDEATYIVTLSHDDKLDNPALAVAVKSKARYIGALGSKKTHAKRVELLKEEGVSNEQIARIHGPVGLRIGAKGPEEIALSVIAEIVATRHAVDAMSMRD